MPGWAVVLTSVAERDFRQLGKADCRRVYSKLDWLSDNFDRIVPQALVGQFGDFYKLRVGDWRVKYKIDWVKQLIIVHYIDRRDKAYRTK